MLNIGFLICFKRIRHQETSYKDLQVFTPFSRKDQERSSLLANFSTLQPIQRKIDLTVYSADCKQNSDRVNIIHASRKKQRGAVKLFN